MKSIRVNEFGSFEVLSYEDIETPEPKENEARVKLEAMGVNYIDIYQRTGLYPNDLPFTPGMEGAGTIDEISDNEFELKKGDRVAYAMNIGSYAEYVIAPPWKLVKIPDQIDAKTAAACMLQGMTAHYLTHSTFKLNRNHTLLLHAAAGGVGLLLTQIAKKVGASIIGTCSSDEKGKLAKAAGADHLINYKEKSFEEEVKKITKNKGVDVVYDSVGKATFNGSLNCLKPRGMLVSFGQSSGAVPDFNPGILSQKGSLFLTRPTLADYASSREELLQRTNDLFSWIKSGDLKIRIHKTYPLDKVQEAHKDIESRKTSGKLLLTP